MARISHAHDLQAAATELPAPLWRIAEGRASCAAGALRGDVALDLPARGVVCSTTDAALEFSVLGVRGLVPEDQQVAPADVYERGGDLVATYAETIARPLRVQVYWRVPEAAHLPAGTTAIDLQVSAQTSLLDADSSLRTVSRVPAKHVARLTLGAGGVECWLFRLPNAALSYVEMIHPADDGGCDLARDEAAPDRWLLERRLFGERLEKGVILRARLRGLLLPRQDDERLAAAACDAFLAESPPLTT